MSTICTFSLTECPYQSLIVPGRDVCWLLQKGVLLNLKGALYHSAPDPHGKLSTHYRKGQVIRDHAYVSPFEGDRGNLQDDQVSGRLYGEEKAFYRAIG